MFLGAMVLSAVMIFFSSGLQLIKEKNWLVLFLSAAFILLSLILSCLLQFGIPFPSVAGMVVDLVDKVFPFMGAFFSD